MASARASALAPRRIVFGYEMLQFLDAIIIPMPTTHLFAAAEMIQIGGGGGV